jgi:ATP-dependent helicase HrpB
MIDDPTLRTLLVTRCAGKRSFAELRQGDALVDEIRHGLFGHAALTALDKLAPAHFAFANGRRAAIEYLEGQAPSVSSRLQDFFGKTETPRIAGGRVPLVLHLLAPNGRDVQVTTDLAGFWSRTYPELRNALMRRYPRHAWPDDPATASPPVPRGR